MHQKKTDVPKACAQKKSQTDFDEKDNQKNYLGWKERNRYRTQNIPNDEA
jgi:hypothetical protein